MKQMVKQTTKSPIFKGVTQRADSKTPNAKDVNQMSSDEIRENLVAIKYAQLSLKGKLSQGMVLEDSSQMRRNRKTIARMLTVLIQRGERVT